MQANFARHPPINCFEERLIGTLIHGSYTAARIGAFISVSVIAASRKRWNDQAQILRTARGFGQWSSIWNWTDFQGGTFPLARGPRCLTIFPATRSLNGDYCTAIVALANHTAGERHEAVRRRRVNSTRVAKKEEQIDKRQERVCTATAA
jgi:hypothetical protein